MDYKIAVLPGDGIGPEIVDAALIVLEATALKYNFAYRASKYPFGGDGIDTCGMAFPEDTKNACLASDAVLLGAVGGPKWDALKGAERPEAALLNLRSLLQVYANLRPATLYKALTEACPLKASVVPEGFDLLVMRELTGGIYFGQKGLSEEEGVQTAFDVESYSEPEVRRIAHRAFQAAMGRRRKVVSVDKANVLESSRLWRRVVEDVAREYPKVRLSHLYVDNAAMQLVLNPSQFDVLLTSNLFGDILSDEASVLTGSIGLLPSASLGDSSKGLYEPIHGSAPDIAGMNLANPIGTIRSVSMMLDLSFGEIEASKAIENAVASVIDKGYRTKDLAASQESSPTSSPFSSPTISEVPLKIVGTREMGKLIAEAIKSGRRDMTDADHDESKSKPCT